MCTDVETREPNAVIIGLAPSKFNFIPMNQAFRLLLDGAKLIAIHKGRYYRQKDGLSLGPGPFVEALEYAADVKASHIIHSCYWNSIIEIYIKKRGGGR